MNVTAPHRHRPTPPGRRPMALRLTVIVGALLVAIVGLSYGQALTSPGSATWQTRSVDWVRGHGGSGLVNLVENIWYSFNAPSGRAPAPEQLPTTGGETAAPVGGPRPAELPLLPGAPRLPGEARWTPGPRRDGGPTALFTGWFRPDPAYPSQVVGAAWLNQSLVRTELIAGTREPGGTSFEQAQVPPEQRPALVAAFNSGWKLALSLIHI